MLLIRAKFIDDSKRELDVEERESSLVLSMGPRKEFALTAADATALHEMLGQYLAKQAKV